MRYLQAPLTPHAWWGLLHARIGTNVESLWICTSALVEYLGRYCGTHVLDFLHNYLGMYCRIEAQDRTNSLGLNKWAGGIAALVASIVR